MGEELSQVADGRLPRSAVAHWGRSIFERRDPVPCGGVGEQCRRHGALEMQMDLSFGKSDDPPVFKLPCCAHHLG